MPDRAYTPGRSNRSLRLWLGDMISTTSTASAASTQTRCSFAGATTVMSGLVRSTVDAPPGDASGSGPLGAAGPDLVPGAGQAAATGQVELPTVQLTGQHPVVDLPEAGQVGLQVRAPPLHHPTVHPDVLGVGTA